MPETAEPAACTGTYVHATCVVVDEAGLLIRGDSGSGKSTLALALIERATLHGRFAALVADDRVHLSSTGGRVVARSHPATEGLVEIRGFGITAIPSLSAAVLRLVVDSVDDAPRLPEPTREAILCGIPLMRLVIDRGLRGTGLVPGLVMEALGVASQPHPGSVAVKGEGGHSAPRGSVA